jgi:hypothetical protein
VADACGLLQGGFTGWSKRLPVDRFRFGAERFLSDLFAAKFEGKITFSSATRNN